MLLSMTGHGLGEASSPSARIRAEVRSVNNKHLKVIVSGEWSAETVNRIEQLVRGSVDRGSVHVRLQVERLGEASVFQLNVAVLESYRRQLAGLAELGEHVRVEALLGLPGVVNDAGLLDDGELAEIAVSAVAAALENLDAMRRREGESMRDNLARNIDRFNSLHAEVEAQAPRVVELFSQRLTERLQALLAKHDVAVQPADLIREVGMFAERTDIHEELVRLSSHIDQFRRTLDGPESNGRKLDFLTQELLRETNTIGSKANDAMVSGCIVEMKALIDRMREMVQNVE
jgi:uncharacterized protein (TIGR00255 family)